MAGGYLGAGNNTWLPNGGTGGGGSGTGDIKMYSGVCGDAGGPTNGATSWTPAGAILVGATQVLVIIVNGVPEVSVGAAPAFSHNSGAGSISRAPNTFITGDTIIGWYKPA